jgi:hypothetical protein
VPREIAFIVFIAFIAYTEPRERSDRLGIPRPTFGVALSHPKFGGMRMEKRKFYFFFFFALNFAFTRLFYLLQAR